MAKVKRLVAFDEAGFRRVQAAIRRVEGTPRVGSQRTARQPVLSGGGQTTIVQANGGPWTAAEFDPASGDILQRFDRGRQRSTALNFMRDTDLLFVPAPTVDDPNVLYTVGWGWLNRNTAVLQKWDADSGELLWESDAGANTGPIHASINAGNLANRVCIASDGFLWVVGSDTSNCCVGRYDPDTGAQTHKFAVALGASLINGIFAMPADGEILLSTLSGIGGTKFALVLDDTATEIHSLTLAPFRDMVIHNGLIYATTSSGSDRLRIFDLTLTTVDQRAAPGAEAYGSLATDGTTVWVVTSGGATPMIRAYDATNLATETWNAAQDATLGTHRRLIHANSALYSFAAHVRKHSETTGAEVWESPSTGIAPTLIPANCNGCQVSSSYVLSLSANTNEQVFLLEESTGEPVWFDEWGDDSWAGLITDTGRIFVCGGRVGP